MTHTHITVYKIYFEPYKLSDDAVQYLKIIRLGDFEWLFNVAQSYGQWKLE
jgi:hypothetical protein